MRSGVADGDDLLINRQIPELHPDQIEQFTVDTLQARPTRSFNPQAALQVLRSSSDKTVIAIDIGGDKLTAASYDLRGGILTQTAELLARRGDNGCGYIEALQDLSGLAHQEMLSVGVSFAGPTDGTRLLAGPNIPTFVAEFHDRYSGDFAKLFPLVTVANDAEAGIMAGALEGSKRYPNMRHVIYVINGSGLGGAVLTDNMILAAEPGHIEVMAKLNPFKQRKPCGVLEATHVCLEVVAASKAGVEDIWLQQTGDRRNGREIAARYLAGDEAALYLYDNSALITAHAIKGMARAFNLTENLDETIVIGHGGIFHVQGYGKRVWSILEKDLLCTPRMLFTKDFTNNACLDGAAIAAAISG